MEDLSNFGVWYCLNSQMFDIHVNTVKSVVTEVLGVIGETV